MGDKMTTAEQSELFRESIASESARKEFAESWAAMIMEVLPVETSVRSIFTVEPVPPGAWPIYTADVQPISAWYLSKFGQAPTNVIEVEEVSTPTFELVGKVEYKIRDAKHGRISIAERTMERLTDSMLTQEEEAGWAVLKAAATTSNALVNGSTVDNGNGLSKKVIDEAWKTMESNRSYQVTDIYVSPAGMADIRGWTTTEIDPVTQREIFVNAGMGSIYRAPIHVVHFLEDDEAYFLDTRPNRLGYMPVREELKTWDNPTSIDKFRVGVVAYEEIGFVVMDPKCIVKASLDRTA